MSAQRAIFANELDDREDNREVRKKVARMLGNALKPKAAQGIMSHMIFIVVIVFRTRRTGKEEGREDPSACLSLMGTIAEGGRTSRGGSGGQVVEEVEDEARRVALRQRRGPARHKCM